MRRILFSPIDIAPLVFFRIAGGCLIALEIVGQATTEYAGAYVSSEVHFSYLYLEWLRPWPPLGIYVHLALNLVMAVCLRSEGLLHKQGPFVQYGIGDRSNH